MKHMKGMKGMKDGSLHGLHALHGHCLNSLMLLKASTARLTANYA
jgi:hypothetical protein